MILYTYRTVEEAIDAKRLAYPVVFREFSDRSYSGWTTRLDSIILELPSSVRMGYPTENVVLEMDPVEAPTSLTARAPLGVRQLSAFVLEGDLRGDVLWLQVQPSEEIDLARPGRVLVIVYVVDYDVPQSNN